MSQVNGAGSVSEILPRHSFLHENFNVFMREARLTRLITEISVVATEISVTRMKIFCRMNTPAWLTRTKFF